MGMTQEGRTAARYWANKLRTQEALFADSKDNERNVEVALRLQTQVIAEIATNKPGAVDQFEAILAESVSSLMSAGAPVVTISMQYTPDNILTDALAEAGIPEAGEAFPWMTTMRVKVGRIRVREGTNARYEDVPLLKRGK